MPYPIDNPMITDCAARRLDLLDEMDPRLEPEFNAPEAELDMFTLANMLKDFKDQKKECQDKEKTLNAVIEATELQLYDLMLAQDLQRFSKGGFTYYLNPKTLASIPAQNNAQVNIWFRSQGMGDLIKETINFQTLNSQLKEMMGEGGTPENLPPMLRPLLNFYDKLSVGVRKG